MPFFRYLKTLHSLKLKAPMKNWLLNGTLTNTKNTEKLPNPSFMISLRLSKFFQTGIKEPTMTNSSQKPTHSKMRKKHSTASSMNMTLLMKKRKNSSMNTSLIPSTITTRFWEFLNQPLFNRSKLPIENLL